MKKLNTVLKDLFTAEQRAEIRQRAKEKLAGLQLQRLRRIAQRVIPHAVAWNPRAKDWQVTGTLATRQGRREGALLNVEERRDGRGNAYFWLGFERARHEVAGARRPLAASGSRWSRPESPELRGLLLG